MTHILIDRETLEALVCAAGAAVEDLVSGLGDGVYEENMLGGYTSEQISEAIETAQVVMS